MDRNPSRSSRGTTSRGGSRSRSQSASASQPGHLMPDGQNAALMSHLMHNPPSEHHSHVHVPGFHDVYSNPGAFDIFGTQPTLPPIQSSTSTYPWGPPSQHPHNLTGPSTSQPHLTSPSFPFDTSQYTIPHAAEELPHSSPNSSHGSGPSAMYQQPGASASADTLDKRQRNTAASARFRIKKKQRTLHLERAVSELTGRTEDLEREAADLRRENGWLKEIVMLKSQHFGHSMNLNFVPPPPPQAVAGPSHATYEPEAHKSSSDSESSEDGRKRRKKGKRAGRK